MRIAQILLDGAAEYERKMQRIDHKALAATHDLTVVHSTRGIDADVAHVYGPRLLHEAPAIPYIANAHVERTRLLFRRLPPPAYVVSPLADEKRKLLPEAVEERYFGNAATGQGGADELRVTSLESQGQ